MCAQGKTPVLLRHPAVNPDRIVQLSQGHLLSPALFNLSWIYTLTQSGFWDAENVKGERSKDPTPEWSLLAQPGKASNPQGHLGKHGKSSWDMKHLSHRHGYWQVTHLPNPYKAPWHTFIVQIHTKIPAPKFQGLSDLWSWKATDGNKTTQLFSDTTTSRHLDTLTGPFLSLFWELDTQLVRVEGRMVPSLPAIAKTAFPKPALLTGIPSGSPSQGQVTRFYTKNLAALAMSPSELTSFPEFFWVWGAQHHVSLLHYGFLWLGSSLGCLPSFFNCSLQKFSRFSSKSESEHAPSDDLGKRVCFRSWMKTKIIHCAEWKPKSERRELHALQ